MALLNLFHHVSASVIQVVCRILPVYLMAVAVVLCLYSFWATIQAYYLSGLNVFPAVKGAGWHPRLSYLLDTVVPPPGSQLLKWMENTPNQGLILLQSPLHENRLLATDTNVLAEILVTKPYHFEKPRLLRQLLQRILGSGLIVTENDLHKSLRKRLVPLFNSRWVSELHPMMSEKADEMVKAIRASTTSSTNSTADVVEISTWASKVTFDIIGAAMLDEDMKALSGQVDAFRIVHTELYELTFEKTLHFLFSAFLSTPFLDLIPWPWNRKMRRCTKMLMGSCRELLEDKENKLIRGGRATGILGSLILSGLFSKSELVDQMLTFLAAGHETTAASFTWTCYLLAVYPEMQTHLRAELIDMDGSAASYERSRLLNGVCKEALRLYPTVPITLRVANQDTSLAGHMIPKGTGIVISPWAVNRSKSIWGDDADQFSPERWYQPTRAHAKQRLLTFLSGPRSCIGQGLAIAELRCLVAAFVRKFSFELVGDGKEVLPAGVITMKPRAGLYLRLQSLN